MSVMIVLLLAALMLVGYYVWMSTVVHSDTVAGSVKERTPPVQAGVRLKPPAGSIPPASASPVPASPSATKGWHMTFTDTNASSHPPMAVAPVRHVNIEVTTRKSDVSAQEIEKRFRFARDKDDALFLAQYYYDKKAYKQALRWALETNKLDSDIEESWLIFGRAKARLGQRIEAIRVLQAYYDRTGSPRAQKLLDAIRRGKTP